MKGHSLIVQSKSRVFRISVMTHSNRRWASHSNNLLQIQFPLLKIEYGTKLEKLRIK